MSGKKQVMDMRSNKDGISTLESNEQQRKWDKDHYQRKASDSLSNYDPTRGHLNFEVTRGGVIQPIDTSKTIAEKMRENLKARGIKNPNDRPNPRRLNRILAQFIFGGNHDRMQEIAFGSQCVDLHKGADNSSVTRSKDIEDWALDVYNFMAKRFGEENIVSCYVHLDEKSPHLHLTLLPVNDNKLSYTAVFGKTIAEESNTMSELHTLFEEEVGRKWGFERGDSKEETKAKHRSTEEYRRELIHTVTELSGTVEGLTEQIRTMERKVKSFSTMLDNLQKQRDEIQSKIDSIKEQFGAGNMDNEELARLIDRYMKELDDIDSKREARQQMLDETTTQLEEARVRLASLLQKNESLADIVSDKKEMQIVLAERDAAKAFDTMLAASFHPVKETLTPAQREMLEDSGFTELSERRQTIMTCSILLFLGYLDKATMYAESHGGGGGRTTGWGRSRDDDDDRWWLKCISKAAQMTSPAGRRKGMRR